MSRLPLVNLEGIAVHPTRARTIRADERSGLEEFIGSEFKRQAKEKTETAANSEELDLYRGDYLPLSTGSSGSPYTSNVGSVPIRILMMDPVADES